MNAFKRYWFLAFGIVIFVAGLISAATGIIALRAKGEELSFAEGLLRRIVILEQEASSVDIAKILLDEMESRTPVDLDVLIQKAGLAGNARDVRDSVDRLNDKWSVITKELTFADVVFSDLENFLADCRQSRPPWVATRISVQSSPFESGRGQVSISLQALRGKTE